MPNHTRSLIVGCVCPQPLASTCCSPRWVTWLFSSLLVALTAQASGAVTSLSPCHPGRFRSSHPAPLTSGRLRLPIDAVTFDGTHATIGDCMTTASSRTRRIGTRLDAAWPRCHGLRAVHLRAVILQDEGCDRMTGIIRARGGKRLKIDAVRSRCGDGVLDPGEACEAGIACPDRSLCRSDCSCEPSPLGTPTTSTTTTTLPPGPPGATCGNGVREGSEFCDGADLGGSACPAGGIATCTPDCKSIDWRGCFACGNGIQEGAEACDGDDFGGRTCATYGYGEDAYHGLHCSVDCTQIITNDCFVCGNGRIDPGEECDFGSDNGKSTCDVTCHSLCGDGQLQAGEQCDDGNRLGGDGCSAQCLVEGTTGGGCITSTMGCAALDSAATPSLDRCYASWGFGGFAIIPLAANRHVSPTCRKGDACDFTPLGPDCTFRYYVCFNNVQFGPGTCLPPAAGIAEISTTDAALLSALEQPPPLGLGGTPANGKVTFSPAYTDVGKCVRAELVVAPGETQTLVADVQSADAAPLLDHDEISFSCTPGSP
jgi:cysteine-rich repeat protein